ncbi:adhesion G protein-coupled receptor E1-like [Scyliorhinus canicula]|uniref:adhesion G protein-coupled receptor E1-like n=1 Tax=Scyliorhinus canicula TaxID=7830 RepID=UPI0018F6601E|nr:adhesion G protein-coupled receptor E1-like [Scyliorhinus canicula]
MGRRTSREKPCEQAGGRKENRQGEEKKTPVKPVELVPISIQPECKEVSGAKNTRKMKRGHCLALHAIFNWVLWNQNIHQSEASHISGEVRSSVTLPCSYDVDSHGIISMCWGRGKCLARNACDNILLKTDSRRVTSNVVPKYKLYGNIERGNVSLTIHGLTLGDEGWYCCCVAFRRFLNIQKKEISLGVYQEASHISGEVRSSVTLPCSYDVDYRGKVSMCWGRGKCLARFSCDDKLLATDGRRVTSNVGLKYNLYGDIERGNVSLTIHGLTLGDEGWYCCRVEFSGPFNDQKEAISLAVYQARPFKCLSDNGSTGSVAECQSDSQLWKSRSDSTFCRFMNFTTELDSEMCNGSGAAFPAKKIIELATRLLSDVTVWKSVKDSERQKAAGRFLETMESAVIAIALGLQKDGKTNWTHPTLDVQIGYIKRDNITGSDMMTLQAKGNTLNVHPSTVIGEDDTALLAFMSYSGLESIMSANLEKEESTDSQKPQQNQFYSKVVTVTRGNRRSHELNGTVNITFKEIQGKRGGVSDSEKFCTFWKSSAEGGFWSTSGCRLTTSNDTHTECSCSHLSSFAVLMALYEIKAPFHSSVLSWITFIGLPISLVCLLLSMATFFCCQSIQNLNTTIRAHLCLSLFLAEVLFLVTSSINKRTVFCSIAAGGLHYLFLAAFVWMLLEAVQLCLMVLNLKVVNFSRARIIRRRFIYPIGYGCPALIVVVCAAVNAEGYGTDTFVIILFDNSPKRCLGMIYFLKVARDMKVGTVDTNNALRGVQVKRALRQRVIGGWRTEVIHLPL